MASIKDLEALDTSAPKSLSEWLKGFSDEERDVVEHAILTARTNDVYPILKGLEDNPYPFERDTLNLHRRRLRAGE